MVSHAASLVTHPRRWRGCRVQDGPAPGWHGKRKERKARRTPRTRTTGEDEMPERQNRNVPTRKRKGRWG